nr:excinuclease ABC subunit C [Micromonospora sp. DSM 115978]
DVIAVAEDELEAAVQVFYVRDGRVRGQRGWVVDKTEAVTTADLVEQFLTQEYLSAEPVTPSVEPAGAADAAGSADAAPARRFGRASRCPVRRRRGVRGNQPGTARGLAVDARSDHRTPAFARRA